jgi:chemotaxis protein CheZ
LQQKTFRIEAMLGQPRARRPHVPKTEPIEQLRAHAYADELAALRKAIARSERELAALHNGAALPRMQRELGAAIGGMEDATQKILNATEIIDESARALQASLQNDYNRGLAQEVLERAVQIYEACNFQDLAGQRITMAIAALQLVERHVAELRDIWGKVEQAAPGGDLINGPRLDDDLGHTDQDEIDRMFAAN